MAGWENLEGLLYNEVIERGEEGCDVEGYRERVAACGGDRRRLMAIYDELCLLPIRSDYPFCEPDSLDAILSLAEKTAAEAVHPADPDSLADRMHGAWLGRCIGCAIGKPLESWPFVCGTEEGRGYEHVRRWLEGADAYPLRGYVPSVSRAAQDGLSLVSPLSQKENLTHMETDDDIRYLVIGLLIAEKYGNDFTPDDVADMWQQYLPARQCCTAELQAYINSLNAERDGSREARWDYCRRYLNPYREWIGAQIRADQYGYVNAGHPLEAAKAAYRDASFSHVKNGIYGAMYMAAVIAAAFSADTAEECIRVGLSVIPRTSRLYADIRQAIRIAKAAATAEELYEKLWDTFGHYNWVHTNNNAAACTAALIFGKNDPAATITTVVACGWDTDCNGATLGSVMGALHGVKGLPKDLVKPLHDTLYSFVPDFHPISIAACAKRSLAVYEKLHGNGAPAQTGSKT